MSIVTGKNRRPIRNFACRWIVLCGIFWLLVVFLALLIRHVCSRFLGLGILSDYKKYKYENLLGIAASGKMRPTSLCVMNNKHVFAAKFLKMVSYLLMILCAVTDFCGTFLLQFWSVLWHLSSQNAGNCKGMHNRQTSLSLEDSAQYAVRSLRHVFVFWKWIACYGFLRGIRWFQYQR